MHILSWLIIGLIAGAIARLLVPGPDSLGIVGTLLLGLAGSFVGGLIITALQEGPARFTPTGLLGSVLGAIVVLLAWRATTRRRRVF